MLDVHKRACAALRLPHDEYVLWDYTGRVERDAFTAADLQLSLGDLPVAGGQLFKLNKLVRTFHVLLSLCGGRSEHALACASARQGCPVLCRCGALSGAELPLSATARLLAGRPEQQRRRRQQRRRHAAPGARPAHRGSAGGVGGRRQLASSP